MCIWFYCIRHRDDVNEDTTAVTAAQQSQAAVLAADSAVEKDGAVTERKHFPMNLNMPGFVVFSVSCLTTVYMCRLQVL